MATRIAIIFAPPGRRKQSKTFLEKFLPDAKFHDITTQMKTGVDSRSTRELATQPRNFLKTQWEKTVNRIVENIKSDDQFQGKLNVLIDHSLLFNGNTREFFPLFNPSFLRKHLPEDITISHVVLLIDDVFDSFHDLSRPEELFSTRATGTFLKLYAKSLGTSYSSLNDDPKADANWISHCVRTLLNWRAKEMLIAQSVADQLGSKFALWGIKQDLEVLCRWINEELKIFYISHPISDPRSKVQTSTDWPPLVSFINSIQTSLKSFDLLTIMPTAIDEYRLEKTNQNYTGKLKLRWPVPKQVKSSLCDSTHSLISEDVDRSNIIHPTKIVLDTDIKRETLSDVSEIQEFLNGVYSSMDMRIEYEIGNRDHTLVWITEGIIVIEPYKPKSGKISGGVEMELHYLQNVNDFIKTTIGSSVTLKDLRKLCAVFTKDSIQKIFENSLFKNKLVPRLRNIIQTKYVLRQKIADDVINDSGKLIDDPTSLGDTTLDSVIEDLQLNIKNFRNQAIIEQFMSSILTIDPNNLDYVCILIIDKVEDFTIEENAKKMKCFLVDSEPFEWKSEFLEISSNVFD